MLKELFSRYFTFSLSNYIVVVVFRVNSISRKHKTDFFKRKFGFSCFGINFLENACSEFRNVEIKNEIKFDSDI